ncbi:hypothetical protein HRbin41_01255 [bacterium HR41]|nr:hypothetical protein HRbin41_01255 [bacterium HR41]
MVKAASHDLPQGLVIDGEVRDKEGLAAALREFARTAELGRDVWLGVANQQIVVRLVDLPPIEDEEELEAAIRFQASEAIAMPLEEAVLDYQPIDTHTDETGAERMRVIVVAARRSMVEELVAAVKAAGLRPLGLDLDAFALVRVLTRANGAGTEPGTGGARVYCHLGGITNLAIARGPACLFTRTVATHWDDEGSADRLADEIRLSIDYYMAQPGSPPVEEVVLSGPGSRDEVLVGDLAAHLALPVAIADPLPGLDPEGRAAHDPTRFTVAAGLALGGQS